MLYLHEIRTDLKRIKTESTQGYCSFMAATNSYLGYRVVCTSSRYDFLLKNNNNNNKNNNNKKEKKKHLHG